MTDGNGKLTFEMRVKAVDLVRKMAKDGKIRASLLDISRSLIDDLRHFVSRHQVRSIVEAAGVEIIGPQADWAREMTARRVAAERAVVATATATTAKPAAPPAPPKPAPARIEQTFDVSTRVREIVDEAVVKLRDEMKKHVALVFQASKEQVTASLRDELKAFKSQTRHNEDIYLETLTEQEQKVAELEQELHRLRVKLGASA